MKHKVGYNRLGRRTGHRKAMTRNMLTSLFRYGRIKTTKAKALAVRRTAEKMITRTKLDSVHNRRIINKDIKDKAVLAKMFTEIGPRFKERPGGYTRVLKLGPRPSDAAEMVILELLSEDEQLEKKSSKKKAGTKSKAKKESAPTKKKAAPVADKGATEKEDPSVSADIPVVPADDQVEAADESVQAKESEAGAETPTESEEKGDS